MATKVISTPLGKEPTLCRMNTIEGLSQPFRFEVFVVTDEPDIDRSTLLRKTMTVSLPDPQGNVRHFHGHVVGFTREINSHWEGGPRTRRPLYTIVLRPWLWLLTLSKSCRVFHNKTVIEIVKEVCTEHGFGNLIEQSLTGTYPPLEYCVQYNETDFAFVSRLLEREGIYYYFRHEEKEHKLVLVDNPDDYSLEDKNAKLAHRPFDSDDRGFFLSWRETHRVRSSSYALSDFDFTNPTKELKVKLNALEPHAYEHGDQFEYPGGYLEVGVGQDYVRSRLHEQNARSQHVSAVTSAHWLTPGTLFTTTLRSSLEYLVVSATSEFVLDAYEEGNPLPKSQTVDKFPPQQRKCELTAIERKTPFRPERVTPKPRIAGVQTAMVVGSDAQAEPGSIDTDEHGRVRVRFAWLDKDKPGQESSCWIRVAQVWAGNAWGGLFVPRIGHEVVVAFAEGDPDRPLIVGSVYNGQAPTPFALPGKATTSGFKTEKVDGSKSTELALDDSSGSIAMTGESIGIDAKIEAGAPPLGGVTLGAAMGDVPMAQVALSVTGGITLIGLTEIALHVGTGKIAINTAGGIELWGAPILANGVPLPGVPPINPMAVKNALEVAKALAPAAIL